MNIFIDPKADLPIVSIINPTPLQRVGGDLNIVGTCVGRQGHRPCRVQPGRRGIRQSRGQGVLVLLPQDHRTSKKGGARSTSAASTSTASWGRSRESSSTSTGRLPVATVDKPIHRLPGVRADPPGGHGLRRQRRPLARDIPGRGQDLGQGGSQAGQGQAAPFLLLARRHEEARRRPQGIRSAQRRQGRHELDRGLHRLRRQHEADHRGREAGAGAIDPRPFLRWSAPCATSLGIKRLSYELSTGEKGEIPLMKGDPFFVKDFDVDKAKGDGVTLTLVAEDPIGNATRLVRAYKIDRKGDRPCSRFSARPPEPRCARATSSGDRSPPITERRPSAGPSTERLPWKRPPRRPSRSSFRPRPRGSTS